MDRSAIVDELRHNRAALQALGLKRVSLFGSAARGDAAAADIDLAVTLDDSAGIDLFRFAALSDRLCRLLHARVDLVVEPARNVRMQAEIDRDRVLVY